MKGKNKRYSEFLKNINNTKNIEEAIQLLNDIRLENFQPKEEKRLRNKIANKVYNKNYDLYAVKGMINYEAIYRKVDYECFCIAFVKDTTEYLDKEKEKYNETH